MARYKKKTSKAPIIAFICVVLAAILVVVAAVGSVGFTKKDVKTWFNNWGKPSDSVSTPTETREPWGKAVDDKGNEMNNIATYAMPAAMAFYSTTSEDVAQSSHFSSPEVTVTCSHNFEFNNIKVDWEIIYPSGANATDVVDVIPEYDGSTKVTLRCNDSFDTTLTLKATLRGNTEKNALCSIDYVKRVTSFNSINVGFNDFGQMGGLTCSPVFGVGSVTGQLKVESAFYSISENFQRDIQSYLRFPITFYSQLKGNTYFDENYCAYDGVYNYDMFINGFEQYDEAHKNAIYYAWNAAFKNGGYKDIGNLDFTGRIELIYNNKVMQTLSIDNFASAKQLSYIDGSTYKNLAPDLTLNNVAF